MARFMLSRVRNLYVNSLITQPTPQQMFTLLWKEHATVVNWRCITVIFATLLWVVAILTQ